MKSRSLEFGRHIDVMLENLYRETGFRMTESHFHAMYNAEGQELTDFLWTTVNGKVVCFVSEIDDRTITVIGCAVQPEDAYIAEANMLFYSAREEEEEWELPYFPNTSSELETTGASNGVYLGVAILTVVLYLCLVWV